ncbi:hypothetical protein ACP8HI_01865 [Paenibacillus sp. FA6]|uniref:hypothetical protein n=1 Tax=Paenibacillus sp. FA6 TaxID=3413029 RepID=UPI003F65E47A
MNSITKSSELKSHLPVKVQGYCTLSHAYMNLATMLLEEGLNHACLIVGQMSVKAMLNAVYLKEVDREGFIDMKRVVFEELLSLVREHDVIDLDAELFLNKVFFLTSLENISLVTTLNKDHVLMIIRRIEELLRSLSERIGA